MRQRCDNCPNPEAPCVFGEWKRKTGERTLMIIGMNPGKQEVAQKRPFVGRSGSLLKQAVAPVWEGRIYVTNAVVCAPKGKKVSAAEAESCAGNLAEEILSIKPDAILSLGEVAKSGLRRVPPEVLEGIPIIQYPHPASTMHGGGMRQGAWVEGCRAALVKGLNPISTIEVRPFTKAMSSYLPSLLGADSEYPGKPPWMGADIYAISDGTVAWATTNPNGDIGGLFKDRTIVFHHAVNELMVLLGMGAELPSDVHDTMVLACLDNEEGPRDLKILAATRCGLNYIEPTKMGKLDETYCSQDARAALLLFTTYPEVRKHRLYTELYRPLFPILARMGYRGLRVDLEGARAQLESNKAKIAEIDEKLKAYADIKWSSDEQVEAYLKSKGYPLEKLTPKGLRFSVDDEVMKVLRSQGVEEAALVLERRHLAKEASAYLQPIINSGGVVRTIYNPVGAETGRISSGATGLAKYGGMNLQNVPKHLRSLFFPPEGKVWVEADASQHEVRVMAWLAERGRKERPLTTALMMSADFYVDIAKEFLGREPSEEERAAFKAAVLAGQYLARPRTVVRRLQADGVYGVSEEQVRAFFSFIETRFPTVVWWRESLFRQAREEGRVTTPLGRHRSVLVGPGGTLSPDTRRIIINSPVQGTASDFCLFALLRAWRAGLTDLLTTTHDSVSVAAHPSEVREVARILKQAFEDEPALEGEPYLKVKVRAGPNWYALEEVPL